MISLTYNMIDLCVLCVSVVPSTPSPAGLYLVNTFYPPNPKEPLLIVGISANVGCTPLITR
ncbi:MAG: hypothetical protein EWV92_14235 [Microcystis aeruginosa Ma_MB_S_20031200_S102]|uniref:Uncharacterized protein n=1 Tax=Microcystis aeruginosa Ma_MB_S_20031200_S102 TaxID=2486254 RepID=A0A552EL00_MICAE|nr:MAG: hypothetical protein EWV79_15985 [Microcystis aeruginosa Ma_MB_S_20031200_S102D]TRU35159.1 MAG: hypothetical protein EWV92_14235 [Microcystis aeruginosa Ma_MB_S_20031200_S102]